jgi:asparagine synthase (glutamine-hydrolysing)
MCGICGRVNAEAGRPVDREAVVRMAGALHHRGPDDQGFLVQGPVGLGMRRLSIIDVAGGQQPIANETEDVWVVCNGEIYNFPELRGELEGRGHRFRTSSDVEVILHLYEERGADCVRALRGMFAFALWDRRQRRLLLARDRVGKKPLLYALRGGDLSFASELKGLLAVPGLAGDLDLESLDEYLASGYIPHPHSIYRGIAKLPPGHTLCWQGGEIRVEPYWGLEFSAKAPLGPAEAAEQAEALLRDAVKVRLMSEVPLGVLLSGGVDSSLVVALMSELAGEPVRTFSIGFEGDPADELPAAREVAERFGTRHTEFTVRPELAAVLPRLARTYDEPFADSSALPSLLVCEVARRAVTVALNGDGGDENFAGYTRYRRAAAAADTARRHAELVRGHFALAPAPAWRRRARRALRRVLVPDAEAAVAPDYFDGAERWALYRPEVRAALVPRRTHAVLEAWEAAAPLRHPLDRMLAIDVSWYLPDDLLYKMDMASMAHSLEARSPFLDHRLLEFTAGLPAGVKCPGGELKGLLKRVAARRLGDDFIRRPKRGFAPPLAAWLRGEVRELAEDLLLGSGRRTADYLEGEAIRRLWREHASGARNHARRLWALVMLELWFRTHHESGTGGSVPAGTGACAHG